MSANRRRQPDRHSCTAMRVMAVFFFARLCGGSYRARSCRSFSQLWKVPMAKNQNTFEKRRREVEKRQRAEEKRKRRQQRKVDGPEPVPRDISPPADENP